MSKYAILILCSVAVMAYGQALIQPEEHFFSIPNADSLSFDWFIALSDSLDYGPLAPEDLDVLRLSPNDYRVVILDGGRGVFLQFQLDQNSPLQLNDLVHSGTGPDTTCSASAMCVIQHGAYFSQITDRVAVAFSSCPGIGVYIFDAASGRFTLERTIATPALRPVGIYWALNNFFVTDDSLHCVIRTDSLGNLISRYGQDSYFDADGFVSVSDISGYMETGSTAHLYVSDGSTERLHHLTATAGNPDLHLQGVAVAADSDMTGMNLPENAYVPEKGIFGFNPITQRLFLWCDTDSLSEDSRSTQDLSADEMLRYRIRAACGRMVVSSLTGNGWSLRSFTINGVSPDNPVELPPDHWTIQHSPVLITYEYHIEDSTTLTIDPGVTVIFSQGASLVVPVSARLVADGTQQLPIQFVGTDNDPAHAWRGICVYSNGGQNLLDRCMINNATVGVRSRDGGRVTLTNCTMTNCGYGVLALYGGQATLTNDTISNSRYYGAVAACSGANLTISNGSITNCARTGVWAVSSSHIYMSGTSVSGNGPSNLNDRNLQYGGTRVSHGSMKAQCIKCSNNNGPGFAGLGGVLDMAPNGKNVFQNNLTVPDVRTQINLCSTLPDLCNGRNLICGDNGDLILACNGEFYDEDITGNHWCGNPSGRVPSTWTNSGNDPDGTATNRCGISNYSPCNHMTPSSEVFALGWDQEEVGQWSAAIASYDSVMKYWPGSEEAKKCPDRILFCESMSTKDWQTQRNYFRAVADTTSEPDLKFAAGASAAWCLAELGDYESAQMEYDSLMDQADSDYKYQKAALEALLAELKETDWGTLGRGGSGHRGALPGLDAVAMTDEQQNDRELRTFALIEALLGTTSHGNSQEQLIPTSYQLYQNYPNPFNPVTAIRFDLPENANVELRVFNTLGQLVTTLVNEERPAGAYTVTWDASSAASGMYICQIRAGDFVDARKLLLLR